MESNDKEIILKLSETDRELRRLYDAHCDYEQKLAKLELRPYLTPSEQMEKQNLKVRKLRGKDKIMRKLRGYKGKQAA